MIHNELIYVLLIRNKVNVTIMFFNLSGDISVLWAVDVPELSHLRNCIVFSQNGDSPVVNSMAGGM